jgi:hypothetical protein
VRHIRHPAARGAALTLASALIAAGCAGTPGDPALQLGLDNATDRPVLVHVNGDWIGTYPAGTVRDDIMVGAHGGPPWRLEARTDEGVVLVAAEVASMPLQGAGEGAAAETTCGDIALWAGFARPDVVPADVPSGEVACD